MSKPALTHHPPHRKVPAPLVHLSSSLPGSGLSLTSAFPDPSAGSRIFPSAVPLIFALSDGPEGSGLRTANNRPTIEDVAARLYLSEGTVRNYLSAAIKKLGVRNRVEAARLAERKGWL